MLRDIKCNINRAVCQNMITWRRNEFHKRRRKNWAVHWALTASLYVGSYKFSIFSVSLITSTFSSANLLHWKNKTEIFKLKNTTVENSILQLSLLFKSWKILRHLQILSFFILVFDKKFLKDSNFTWKRLYQGFLPKDLSKFSNSVEFSRP